jgi:hypothetical protein
MLAPTCKPVPLLRRVDVIWGWTTLAAALAQMLPHGQHKGPAGELMATFGRVLPCPIHVVHKHSAIMKVYVAVCRAYTASGLKPAPSPACKTLQPLDPPCSLCTHCAVVFYCALTPQLTVAVHQCLCCALDCYADGGQHMPAHGLFCRQAVLDKRSPTDPPHVGCQHTRPSHPQRTLKRVSGRPCTRDNADRLKSKGLQVHERLFSNDPQHTLDNTQSSCAPDVVPSCRLQGM